MYAERIVQNRIEKAQIGIDFRLEYHSPEEIDTFEFQLAKKYEAEYMSALRAAQGKAEPGQAYQDTLTKLLCNPLDMKLSNDERRFIDNERRIVMCDTAYFMTRYYWILTDEGHVERFRFRSGQRIFFNILSDLEDRNLPIEILLAKARQLGMTTVVIGILLPKTMFSVGVSSIEASADGDKTREMAQKMFMAYDKLPWWLRTAYTKRSEGEKGYLKFGSIDSGVIFQHGSQTSPIAMGNTIVGYHLSEVSSYTDPQKLINIGLFKAVHPSPRILGVLESTCKGDTGWFHDTYWHAKAKYDKGLSRLFALFLPFYCAADMYPNQTENRAHPVPAGWEPDPATRAMIAESKIYVDSNPVLAKVLREGAGEWDMRREQAFYWEWNYLEALATGTEKDWYQEMPHTDKAAFQGSYENVFGKDVIAKVFEEREKVYETYAIVGQSIEERHEPHQSELDYERVRVPIRWKSMRGEHYRWELVPLAWEELFRELADIRDDEEVQMGKLFVYLPPEPGYDYSIGVDTSNGIGSDGTVIAVSRRGRSPQERDEEAAEFRDNKVSHVEAFAWVAAITAYYSRYMKPEFQCPTHHANPYLSIEQVLAVGDTCQAELRRMGFSRFHKMTRYDSTPQKSRKKDAHKVGWYTFGYTRAILTDTFVTLVQNDWYKINSAYTTWEAGHWEVRYTGGGKSKFEHGEDSTDDGLFANALAAFCPNDTASIANRTAKQWRGEDGKKPPPLDVSTTPNGSVFHVHDSPQIIRPRMGLTYR